MIRKNAKRKKTKLIRSLIKRKLKSNKIGPIIQLFEKIEKIKLFTKKGNNYNIIRKRLITKK